MAKIIITIEDMPGDKVKSVMSPPFAQLAMKVKNSLTPLTAAEIYGIAAINKIMDINRSNKKEKTRIIIPNIGRNY